ncbi:MAG: hypothetical protein Q8P41_04735 [Pseudomonadota bacterium]|nr:hypothetical protein [Pseudomonadota bacterium]
MSFFPPIPVSAGEAGAIARALHTVAACDSLHPRELAMIRAFSEDLGEAPSPIEPAELAAALPGGDHRLLCLKLALLVAHAEGEVSEAERVLLGRYATALELTDADMLALEEQVLEEMVARAG